MKKKSSIIFLILLLLCSCFGLHDYQHFYPGKLVFEDEQKLNDSYTLKEATLVIESIDRETYKKAKDLNVVKSRNMKKSPYFSLDLKFKLLEYERIIPINLIDLHDRTAAPDSYLFTMKFTQYIDCEMEVCFMIFNSTFKDDFYCYEIIISGYGYVSNKKIEMYFVVNDVNNHSNHS